MLCSWRSLRLSSGLKASLLLLHHDALDRLLIAQTWAEGLMAVSLDDFRRPLDTVLKPLVHGTLPPTHQR